MNKRHPWKIVLGCGALISVLVLTAIARPSRKESERDVIQERNSLIARAEKSPEDLNNVLGELLAHIKTSKGNEQKLRYYADLYDLFQANRRIPRWIADAQAPALTELIRSEGPALDSIGAVRTIHMLPMFAGSPEAKKFILEVLRGKPNRFRTETIRLLNWTESWINDKDIFDALVEIHQKDPGLPPLGAMQRVDSARAVSFIQDAIKASKEEKRLMELSSLVSIAHDDKLASMLIEQMRASGHNRWSKIDQLYNFWNPKH